MGWCDPEFGSVWGLCHCGGGVWRCGVFDNGDKVQFVKLFGQVLCGEADKLKGGED